MLKFSTFLSCMYVTKCVKIKISRYKGFKAGIFRISPIEISHLLTSDIDSDVPFLVHIQGKTYQYCFWPGKLFLSQIFKFRILKSFQYFIS